MTERILQSRVAQLLLVAVVLVGAVAVAPAAGQLLAGDGTDYVQGFTANESEYINYTVESDGADYSADGTDTIYMNVTYDGTEHLSVSQDATGSNVNQTFNRTHDELNTLPGAPGQNTTVTVNAWGEASNGTITTSVSSFNVDIEFDTSRSVMYFGNTSASEIDIEEFDPGFLSETLPLAESIPFVEDPDQADTYTIEESRSVSGDTTDITIHMDDSDLQSGFDEQTDAYSSGDSLLGLTVSVDDELVPVFYQSRNTDIASSNDTHAVYEDGQVDVELGSDDYGDANNVSVMVASHNPLDESASTEFTIDDVDSAYDDELDVPTLRKEFSIFDIGITRYIMAGGPLSGLLGALLLLPVARRKQGAEE